MAAKKCLSGTAGFAVRIVRRIKNLAITILKGIGALTFVFLVFEIAIVTVKRILKVFERRRS